MIDHMGHKSVLGLILTIIIVFCPAGLEANADEDFEKSLIEKHLAISGAECIESEVKIDLKSKLPDGNYLYAVRCSTGAYNMVSHIYILQKGDLSDLKPEEFRTQNNWYKVDYLFNVSFDETNLELSSYQRFRGIGDCGNSGTWRYTNNGFELLLFRSKEECDGELSEWPIIFQQ